MRLIIAGSRTVDPTDADIDASIASWFVFGSAMYPEGPTAVVCGMASGADLAGLRWAERKGLEVIKDPVTQADYDQHGRYLAPKMRNRRMAELADAAIIFWDGTSGGSSDMCARMVARRKPVEVIPMAPRSKRR